MCTLASAVFTYSHLDQTLNTPAIIKPKKKPNPFYSLLLLTGSVLVACSFLLVKQTFDIRIFDTFYVIRLNYLYLLLAAMLAGYWLFYKYAGIIFFSASLISIHIILSMLACVLIIIFHISSGQLYVSRTGLNLYDVLRFQKNNFILTILLLVLGAIQCLFAFNLLWSFFKKR